MTIELVATDTGLAQGKNPDEIILMFANSEWIIPGGELAVTSKTREMVKVHLPRGLAKIMARLLEDLLKT
jgi:hypothetical protein